MAISRSRFWMATSRIDHRRLRRRERGPGLALVDGHEDPVVGAQVEHVGVVRILLDVEDRVVHAARDVGPRLAEVLRHEQPGLVLVVRAVAAERHVGRVLVERRRHDALHPAVVRDEVALDARLRLAGGVVELVGDVHPGRAAVRRHLHVAVVGAGPVEARLLRRLGEGVDRRPLQVGLARERELLLARLRQVRADLLERALRAAARASATRTGSRCTRCPGCAARARSARSTGSGAPARPPSPAPASAAPRAGSSRRSSGSAGSTRRTGSRSRCTRGSTSRGRRRSRRRWAGTSSRSRTSRSCCGSATARSTRRCPACRP